MGVAMALELIWKSATMGERLMEMVVAHRADKKEVSSLEEYVQQLLVKALNLKLTIRLVLRH